MKSVTAETQVHGEHGIARALRESRDGAPSRVQGADRAPDRVVSGVSRNPERVVVVTYCDVDLITESFEDISSGKLQFRRFQPPHIGLTTVL